MKAWIVKWNWSGDHSQVERPIIAILSARSAPESVRQFVEQLYAIATYTLEEQLRMAHYTRPLEPPYKAQFETVRGVTWEGGVITCGHNPYVEAFKADDVRIADNEVGLTWSTRELQRKREEVVQIQRRMRS